MEAQSIRWIADGNAVNINLGFIPDFAIMLESTEDTNPNVYLWMRNFEQLDSLYGLLITGSTGVITRVTTAATGLAQYDAKIEGVLVESPVAAADDVFTSIADYNAATTYTARSATAVGSVVRPNAGTRTTGLCYECTTASGGASGTEPTWPTVKGDSVTAGSTDVWVAIDENVATKGAQGITAGATTQTDSDQNYIFATKTRNDTNAGDAAQNTTFIPQ